MGRLFLPKPTTPIARAQALRFHNRMKALGRDIPHFFDEDGVRFYIDRDGKGRQNFRNLGSKLAVEAGRQERAAERTPTQADYVDVYGPKLGKQLYKTERTRLSQMYSNYDPSTEDMDHIDSMADGGMNLSRNLRPMNASQNRAEGARNLTAEQKTAVLSGAPDVKTAIQQQGPVMTTEQTNEYLRTGRAWMLNAAKVLGRNPGKLGARGAGAGLGTVESRSNPMIQEGSVFELNSPLDNMVERTSQVKENPYTPTGRGI